MKKFDYSFKLDNSIYLEKTTIYFIIFFFFPLISFCQVITKVTNGATSIDITANSSQTGTLYYVLYSSTPSSSTAVSIKNDAIGSGGGNIKRNGTLTIINGETGQDLKKLISNLGENTTYQLYGVFESGGNLGSVQNFSPSLGIRQQSLSYKSQITVDNQFGYKIRYWVYRPESYYKNPTKNYPVLMFFHGLGELGQNDGDENRIINAGGPPRLIRDGQEMEYIVVSPQAYNDGAGPVRYATQGWLSEVLDQIKATNRVDAERVYLTGLSLGGRAVYKLAEEKPTGIAAMLPASGVYDWWLKGNTCTYKNVPFWGFANSGDPVVNINSNLNSFMSTVNGCQPAPTTPHLTTIYNANQHDSWSAMYNTGDVYQWLLSKTLSNPLNKVLSVSPGTYPNITASTYNLSGSASSNNGNIVYYEWTKRQGPDVTIINQNSATPTLQDLKKGNYVFRFFVTDANGGSGYADVNFSADPSTDNQAPTAPSNLVSTNQTTNSISLSWGASTDNVGVTGYDIYQGNTLVGSVNGTTTTFTLSNLTINTSYSFTVKAKDAANNISGASNQLTISTLADTQAPSIPANLISPNQTNTSVSLSWTASTDNVGVTEYDIFQGSTQVGTVNGTTTSFLVSALTINTPYVFTVAAKDAAGNMSSKSAALNISTTNIVPDTQAPTAPSNLTSTNQTFNSISLSWGVSTDNVGVTGYDIYQGNTFVGSVNGTTTAFTVNNLTINTSYSFTVKAKDAANNISGASNQLTISTLGDTQAPSIPANLISPNQTNTSVSLSWTASTDNIGVTEYDIFQGGTQVGTVNGTTTSFLVSALTINTPYVFTVAAKDAAGNMSSKSAVLNISTTNIVPDTQAPTAPSNLTSTNQTFNSISLSWGASTDNVGVTGYDIYQGNTFVGSVNGTTTTFTVNNLTINTSYSFTVKAKDAANNISGASNQLTISTLADTQAPSIPANLISPNQTNTSVSLSWTASTDNIGVTEYDIFQGGTQVGTVNGTTTSFLVSALTINTPYVFTVAAKDAAGNMSSKSAVLNISTTNNVPDTQAPSAPSNLTSSNQTNNSISLNWIASTDNVGVTGYDIFQGNTQVGTVNGTTLNYVAQNLTANTSYDFTVKAKDAAGNISAAGTKLTISTTNVQDTQPPTIPLNLISTSRSINTVSLSWDPSTDNVGVTGYEIYSGATLIGNVNSTSFIVTSLIPSTGYTFTVLAKDAASNKSGLSNPVTISTLSAPDTQAPSAPGNLISGSQTSKSISIQWALSADNVGVVGYDIYNGNSLIASVGSTENSYIILNLQPSTSLNLTVKAKDAAGNISPASNSVLVSTLTNSPPVVKLDSEQSIILPLDSLTITATATDVDNDPLTYSWSSNVDNINPANNKTNTIKLSKLTLGSYILTLTVSDNLSESVARIKVNVLAAEIRDTVLFHAKRIFSPNGDGNNDDWSIKNINTFPNSKISILNASGQIIFTASSSNSDEFIWDGRAGGRDLPEGAYYYVVENGNKSIGSGSFVLIR